MHIEVLAEDSSGKKLLELLLPKLLGNPGEPHTWRVIAYRGVGRIPPGLNTVSDPSKRALLNQLPRLLRGYGQTPGIDAVVVVLDVDKRSCVEFLVELKGLLSTCRPAPRTTMFRLAIEEVEAWYLGDQKAVIAAYPKVRQEYLQKYVQDSACNTWELLADATIAGGSAEIIRRGWPSPGQIKHEWAERIGPLLDPDRNASPSFCKLRDGLRALVSARG